MRIFVITFAVALFATIPAWAEDEPGDVRLPLDQYNDLVDKAAAPQTAPVAAPADFALGRADVSLQVTPGGGGARTSASVTVQLRAEVFTDEWVLVPLLSAGTAVSSATVSGSPVQLISSPDGVGWSVHKAGVYDVQLVYSVDAMASAQGESLGLPVPRAAVTNLTAVLPGSGLDVAVIPSAGATTSGDASFTTVNATIPSTSAVHLSWRQPIEQGHAVSRATYSGRLAGDAVIWSAELDVELFGDAGVELQLLPRTMTLSDVKVDGRDATITAGAERFAAVVRGAGAHQVTLGFETPVSREEGPPRVTLSVPEIPVSRFELTLPGRKEVSVQPASSVTHTHPGKGTVAAVNVPLSDQVILSWSEAVPEEVRAELRTNADVYHAVHAEEGVLYVHAMMVYEVTRGETNQLEIQMPPDAVVNDIRSSGGAVAEWSPRPGAPGKPYPVSVFLNRQVNDQVAFDVLYERKLGTGERATDPVQVPLVSASDVNRQRGMVALLASKEFTLKPSEDEAATRVGENQLPAFVREAVDMTIAHTFKYVEQPPALKVQPAVPERREGKFDAQVDTLVSLGDVTLKGAASVAVDVKSGGIMELELALPAGINLLGLSAPSLRAYTTEEAADGAQVVDVQFTQEMDGQFRLEVVYEQILEEGATEVIVPLVAVAGAEVEQGRIGVEALSAVEVQPSSMEHLSTLDTAELPQQLILRTTNPILLSYKYVQANPPARLGLSIARHQEIDVQRATIDQADYRTLVTRDGLAVTTATFTVRNSSQQFLKVSLPKGSEVWSAFVDGRSEKPALVDAEEGGDEQQILVKIINSAKGFPVELIYATDVARIGAVGKVRGTLPRPDMVVTRTHWDVYLPADVAFGAPRTNMEVSALGEPVTAEEMAPAAVASSGDTLRIEVPTSGVRYSFDKLYANRSDEEASFALPYTSVGGVRLARLMGLGGTAVIWLGALLGVHRRLPRRLAAMLAGLGAVLVGVSVISLGGGLTLPLVVSAVIALGLAARPAVTHLRGWKGDASASDPVTTPPA